MDRAEFNFWIGKKTALTSILKLQLAPIKESLYISHLDYKWLLTWIIHLVDWGKCITHGVYFLYKKPWSKNQCVSSHENFAFQTVFVSSSNLFSSFLRCVLFFAKSCYYSITPLIRNNWTASHPDMRKLRIIGFFWKYATLAVCSSAVTSYSMYLPLNLSTTLWFAVLEAITLYCTWSDKR